MDFSIKTRVAWHKLKPVNSSPPSAAYLHQRTGSALVQIMACRLFGAKPLPEPMLAYCQLNSWEHISMKFEPEFYHFHSRKCIWTCRLPKWQPFCQGGWCVINFLCQQSVGWSLWCHDFDTLAALLLLYMGNTLVPVDSQYKGPVRQNTDGFFVFSLDKLLNKKPSDQWNEIL